MKWILAAIIMLLPLNAQAARFPYQSVDFFKDCSHLAKVSHDEPTGQLMLDVGCERYIEGFEIGFASNSKSTDECAADPAFIFQEAQRFYGEDKHKDSHPWKYLSAAVAFACSK